MSNNILWLMFPGVWRASRVGEGDERGVLGRQMAESERAHQED